MKSGLWLAFCAALMLAFVVGCHHSASGELSSAEVHAFDQAAPDLKQIWMTALEASKTNDYVGAQTMLYGLLNQNLSPDQKNAVTKESTALNDRLYAALEKGDPAAQKAMEDLRKNPPGRQGR
jgi:hypothetical protein